MIPFSSLTDTLKPIVVGTKPDALFPNDFMLLTSVINLNSKFLFTPYFQSIVGSVLDFMFLFTFSKVKPLSTCINPVGVINGHSVWSGLSVCITVCACMPIVVINNYCCPR
jgi:hypothetical protein